MGCQKAKTERLSDEICYGRLSSSFFLIFKSNNKNNEHETTASATWKGHPEGIIYAQ
jgi:hypothetical protein